MSDDRELVDVINLDDPALEGIIHDDAARLDPDDEARNLAYMEDLQTVLNTTAGIRVLRVWLDMASAFGSIFQTNANIYRSAALHDFAQDRLGEIMAADPKQGLKVLLEGARERKTQAVKSKEGNNA